MIKKSFTLRVLMVSFLCLALPLLIDSFIFSQASYYDSVKSAKRGLSSEATYRAFDLLNLQPVREVLLHEIIFVMNLSDELENPNQEQLNRQLKKFIHGEGKFNVSILTIKEPDYTILASSDPSATHHSFVSFELMPKAVQEGKGSFIRYTFSEIDQRFVPFIYMIQVVYSKRSGKPLGILMISSDISQELDVSVQKSLVHENILFALLNSEGVVFSATDPSLVGQYFHSITPERREAMIQSGQIKKTQLPSSPLPVIPSHDFPYFEFVFKDQVQIAYQTPVPSEKITMMSYSQKEALFGIAVKHFLFVYLTYGVIFLIGAIVAYWLSSWVSRPLRQLTQLMFRVSQGELDKRFQKEPLGFEINLLGDLFNHTLDNLLENIQKAEDERVRKETYQRELSIVRQLQYDLLPNSFPQLKGAECAGFYLPAHNVGGDYYVYLQKKMMTGEEALFLATVDSPGKGLSSNLYTFALRALFRTYATLYDDVGEILKRTNNHFIEDAADSGLVIPVLLGMYVTDTRKFNYLSCDHVTGFVKRADGEIYNLVTSKAEIGLKKAENYSVEEIQLFSGDALVLYSEGLMSIRNEHKELYTEVRFKKLLQSREWKSSQAIIEEFSKDIHAFTHTPSQEEEIIVVVLKVH